MGTVLREKLEESCELRGTEYVQGQIYECIFAENIGYWVYHPSNILQHANSCSAEVAGQNWDRSSYHTECSKIYNFRSVSPNSLDCLSGEHLRIVLSRV